MNTCVSELTQRALNLYDGILRRDREDYAEHPRRMIENAMRFGWVEPDLHLLIALHDVFEVVEGFTIRDGQVMFGLSPEECIVLDLLTRKENETSEQHFNRVLKSNNQVAYRIKFLDNFDNSIFNMIDQIWHVKTFETPWVKESMKYSKRARQFFELIIKD